MSPVGEGVKVHRDLKAIEGRGEIDGKVVSMALLLGHKVTATSLVNRMMVQRWWRRETCVCLSEGKRSVEILKIHEKKKEAKKRNWAAVNGSLKIKL